MLQDDPSFSNGIGIFLLILFAIIGLVVFFGLKIYKKDKIVRHRENTQEQNQARLQELIDNCNIAIETVPAMSAGSAFRTYDPDRWQVISHATKLLSNDRCPYCGKRIKSQFLEAHEVWKFDDENHLQKLVKVEAICSECHRIKHYFRTQRVSDETKYKRLGESAFKRMMKLNNWNEYDAKLYVNFKRQWMRDRDHTKYELDLSNYESLYKSCMNTIKARDSRWLSHHKDLMNRIEKT